MSSKFPMRPAKPLPPPEPIEAVWWPDREKGPYVISKKTADMWDEEQKRIMAEYRERKPPKESSDE